MPAIIDTNDRADTTCTAVIRLLNRGGIEAVTLRAIGAVSGISPASLLHHLRSRDRILNVSASRVRERLDDLLLDRSLGCADPVSLLFAADDEQELLLRAYLAFRELSRTHQGVAEAIAQGDFLESVRVRALLGVPDEHAEILDAVLFGLRDAMAKLVGAMSQASSVRAIRLLAAALVESQAQEGGRGRFSSRDPAEP